MNRINLLVVACFCLLSLPVHAAELTDPRLWPAAAAGAVVTQGRALSPAAIPARESAPGDHAVDAPSRERRPVSPGPEAPSEAEAFFSSAGGLQPRTPPSSARPGDSAGSEGQSPAATTAALAREPELRQFGYDFFRKGEGFQPDLQAPVGPDYVVGPGDTLRIDVWGNIEGSYQVEVDRQGQIVLPKVGAVQLWGQSFEQARETIRKAIGKYFTHFELNVTLGGLRSIQVFLVGEVASPGAYQVSSLSTTITALTAGGGPTRSGSLRQVRLLRQGKVVAEVDLYDFFLRGDKSRDLRLQSGDTIFVPVVGPLVGVAGNVRRPGIYELKGGESLGQALELAGGIVSTAYLQRVEVQRIEAHQRRTALSLDLSKDGTGEPAGLATPIQDRDLVRISPIALSGNYVKVSGYAMRPGDYQLTPGMRLADLIVPYDNLPPEFYPGMAQLVRRAPPEYRPEILTVHLQKALQGDPEHNLELREFDELRLFSRQQMEESPEIMVSGAVLRPGTYPLMANMTVRDLVATAGNLKRMAYLSEAEITRFIPRADGVDTRRFNIDLAQALAGDPQHNLLLQADDHLIVRTIPDFGEKLLVTLRGEVVFPGQYVITKGERLSALLHRAGGFTDDAYLRGSLFARESLKELQRQRMEKLMLEQEQEILQLSSKMTQGALSPEDAAAAKTLLENRKALLEKIRQTPVTGRMVVQLAALPEFTGSEYDIELMGGDTLFIPKSPQSVTVLGEVYNQTSLTYVPGDSVGDYLDKVGGTTAAANRSEMFVVRADGTVVSRHQTKFLLFNGFNGVELYPGDAVLVPEKVERTNVMKEVKDLATIIYQMALGAAAVASF